MTPIEEFAAKIEATAARLGVDMNEVRRDLDYRDMQQYDRRKYGPRSQGRSLLPRLNRQFGLLPGNDLELYRK